MAMKRAASERPPSTEGEDAPHPPQTAEPTSPSSLKDNHPSPSTPLVNASLVSVVKAIAEQATTTNDTKRAKTATTDDSDATATAAATAAAEEEALGDPALVDPALVDPKELFQNQFQSIFDLDATTTTGAPGDDDDGSHGPSQLPVATLPFAEPHAHHSAVQHSARALQRDIQRQFDAHASFAEGQTPSSLHGAEGGGVGPGVHADTAVIFQGLATGQMKHDPNTNCFVPNDIFVASMLPGGELPGVPCLKKHSKFRGVTKHRRSGRWESHIWLKDTGRQMYLGAYEEEEHAAEAYDIAALKVKGATEAKLNFDIAKYDEFLPLVQTLSLAELVKTVKKRTQPPPPRTSSQYRGVTYNLQHGMWEAKWQNARGDVESLGLYRLDVDAARAFDRIMVRTKGTAASINFGHAEYEQELLWFHGEQIKKLDAQTQQQEQ